MSWIVIVLLALAVFVALLFGLKLPRDGREMTGAALLLGLAGYALYGSPGLPGAPNQARETAASGQAALIEVRKDMGDGFGAGSRFLITSDALMRRGQYATAAGFIEGALRSHPGEVDLWVALGNALIAHADGIITPASLYAYRRAAQISPDHPGPPFFTGLALAQSGRFAEARAIWGELLSRPAATDEDADEQWREALAIRLEQLDAMIEMQRQMQAQGGGQPNSGPLPVP